MGSSPTHLSGPGWGTCYSIGVRLSGVHDGSQLSGKGGSSPFVVPEQQASDYEGRGLFDSYPCPSWGLLVGLLASQFPHQPQLLPPLTFIPGLLLSSSPLPCPWTCTFSLSGIISVAGSSPFSLLSCCFYFSFYSAHVNSVCQSCKLATADQCVQPTVVIYPEKQGQT